jgi:2-phospho-L-lactate guanylyltransferase
MWTILVPLKPLALAKSRLRGAAPESAHEELVLAMAQSTANAALTTDLVTRLVFISNQHVPYFETVPDGYGTLNEAIRHAEQAISGAVAVLPADLPALDPGELGEALRVAAARRSFVADASGRGTTLLAAPAGGLRPSFGPGSARAHERSGARRLENPWPTLRRDVDTADDLHAAIRLGWHPPVATRRLLHHRG